MLHRELRAKASSMNAQFRDTYIKFDTFLVKKDVRYMKDHRKYFNDYTIQHDGALIMTMTDYGAYR
jgi:hypothetical protein